MQATHVQIKNYHLLFSNKKNPVKRGLGGGAVILTTSIYAALMGIILISPHTNPH
jgi:hypothetical protein